MLIIGCDYHPSFKQIAFMDIVGHIPTEQKHGQIEGTADSGLINNRPDLDYVKIALFTSSNLTAVRKVARDNGCQRKRGGGPKKPLPQHGV